MVESKIEQLFGVSDKWFLQRSLNPSTHWQRSYILLDTDNADSDLTENFTFGWNIINYLSNEAGSVSTAINIRDLVAVRLMPVSMQLTSNIEEPGKSYTNTIANVSSIFTVLMRNFLGDSFIGRDGRRFHFALSPKLMNPQIPTYGSYITPAAPYYECTTIGKSNGWYWFKLPITEIKKMELVVYNAFDAIPVNMPAVRMVFPMEIIYMAEKVEA
jgi:hypothetical protein